MRAWGHAGRLADWARYRGAWQVDRMASSPALCCALRRRRRRAPPSQRSPAPTASGSCHAGLTFSSGPGGWQYMNSLHTLAPPQQTSRLFHSTSCSRLSFGGSRQRRGCLAGAHGCNAATCQQQPLSPAYPGPGGRNGPRWPPAVEQCTDTSARHGPGLPDAQLQGECAWALVVPPGAVGRASGGASPLLPGLTNRVSNDTHPKTA